jgi:hypothetical protein
LQHKAANCYRCSLCSNSFCSGCRTVPYHEGLSCREAAAPCCPFCNARVPDAAVVITGDMSVRQLRDAASSLGADCSWCLERGELVSVYKRAKQVCSKSRHDSSYMTWAGQLEPGNGSGAYPVCLPDGNCKEACWGACMKCWLHEELPAAGRDWLAAQGAANNSCNQLISCSCRWSMAVVAAACGRCAAAAAAGRGCLSCARGSCRVDTSAVECGAPAHACPAWWKAAAAR